MLCCELLSVMAWKGVWRNAMHIRSPHSQNWCQYLFINQVTLVDQLWNILFSAFLLPSGIVCGLGGFILACALCFFCYKRKLKKHSSSVLLVQDLSPKSFSNKNLESISFHCQTHLFSYQELKDATNGFDASKELGDGGYGTVYKGQIASHHKLLASKHINVAV